jgi:hypothetical protein
MSDQNHDGDAFVAAVEVVVGTECGAMFDGITGILLENTPFFTKNDAGDETFFFAPKKRFPESSTKRTAFSCGAVAMDDFERNHAGLPGLAEFGEETLTSFFDGGEISLNVKDLECGHGAPERIVPEGKR